MNAKESLQLKLWQYVIVFRAANCNRVAKKKILVNDKFLITIIDISYTYF
jgi:hypothetical protein